MGSVGTGVDQLGLRRARKLLEMGMEAVSEGDYQLARDRFQASAEANPSADALTYWAWMEHNLGNTRFAIELCHQAIRKDPTFGNPYNDIGSYLISMGDLDEAIPWLEKAIRAERYEPRQFPHINLGKIFFAKDFPMRAIREFQKALEYSPGDPDLLETIQKIRSSLTPAQPRMAPAT